MNDVETALRLKRERLQRAPISSYCSTYIEKMHAKRSEQEKALMRETWDYATAKFMALMHETGEVGMQPREAQDLMQRYREEIMGRVLNPVSRGAAA